jgi:hypothetical protein
VFQRLVVIAVSDHALVAPDFERQRLQAKETHHQRVYAWRHSTSAFISACSTGKKNAKGRNVQAKLPQHRLCDQHDDSDARSQASRYRSALASTEVPYRQCSQYGGQLLIHNPGLLAPFRQRAQSPNQSQPPWPLAYHPLHSIVRLAGAQHVDLPP